MMKRNRISAILFAFLYISSVFAQRIVIDIPESILGRDYVIASRIEKMNHPVEMGSLRMYEGLRIYNPQLIRFSVSSDSLRIVADDTKKGPVPFAVPIVYSNNSIQADITDYFRSVLRGVDVLSVKKLNHKNTAPPARITMHRGDYAHMEVSVQYECATDSADFVTTLRKSLFLLPENPMTPRPFDGRVGYREGCKGSIDRFNLGKGTPVTFYVDNRFPLLWQKAIRQGIEDWNIAFARAGHPAAIRAVGFDEAGEGFDPFDFTNNCFYMVESDFANAMGNHWIDPRSGEILQADVQFYGKVSEKLRTWLLLHTGAYNRDVAHGCVSDSAMARMLRYAAAHEVGHCLGLEHNYCASFSYPTDSLRNASFCATHGTTPSIMDYARFNYVAQPGDGVKSVYPPLLGEYDIYAIEAGYRDFDNDAAYREFIDAHQSSSLYLYKKAGVSTLPKDEAVQQTDLGNDHLASTRYGIANIKALPLPVLEQLKADDVHSFYFQLLTHIVPCLDRKEVKAFLEKELNQGYLILNSPKMQKVYGDQSEKIEQRRYEFLNNVRRQYDLAVATDPLSTGLWMPHQMLGDDVFSMLRKDGFRLSKNDIYDINKRCLSGSVLSLSTDNGVSSPYASASFVSKDGLVLTNFHCVSSKVQQLANQTTQRMNAQSTDYDYMKDGCWATSRKNEAPLFGLELHQLLSIEDVTDSIVVGLEGLSPDDYDAEVEARGRNLMKKRGDGRGVSRKVYSLMGGQQFILARYLTFTDVRIVACPPMWIGAYGGDDDNWRWPRYSCDFAFLRAYVGPKGDPAKYSDKNEPYHPKSFLRIAKRGVEKGDPVMVMGYPGQTRKNIPAYALDKIVNNDTRLRANALKAKIDYLRKCSANTTGNVLSGYNVRIGKLMNVYLRSRGEIEGVANSGLVEMKRREDMRLQEWINQNPGRKARYGENLIACMDSVYSLLTQYNHMDEAFSQFAGSGVGIIPFAGKFEKLISIDRAKRKSRDRDMKREIRDIQRNIREFFPSISMAEDCGMMKTLLPLYLKAVPKKYLPEGLKGKVDVDRLYATSLLTDSAKLERFLAESIEKGTQELVADSLYRICIDIYRIRVQRQTREAAPLKRLNTKLYGIYMRAKAEMGGGALVPFEANRTMRMSTGRVKDLTYIAPAGKEKLECFTSSDVANHGKSTLTVACFSTNAETVAGNSGSAVVNARGELVGLNFDRTASSVSSIYRSDPFKARNIAVSTDFILWVIRNLSHSQYILDELK